MFFVNIQFGLVFLTLTIPRGNLRQFCCCKLWKPDILDVWAKLRAVWGRHCCHVKCSHHNCRLSRRGSFRPSSTVLSMRSPKYRTLKTLESTSFVVSCMPLRYQATATNTGTPCTLHIKQTCTSDVACSKGRAPRTQDKSQQETCQKQRRQDWGIWIKLDYWLLET